MKTIFLSNKITPHQLPCCIAFEKSTDFTFVETMKGEFKDLGWCLDGENYPFVIPYTEDAGKLSDIQKQIMDADVVIWGSAPDSYVIPRLKAGKLCFRYSERLYKDGLSLSQLPRAAASAWLHHGRFQKAPLYMLCASAYTAIDCARFGNYKDRMYKWGYFPETRHYDLGSLFSKKRQETTPHLLWAGRFLDLKHPDVAIDLAKALKKSGYSFKLDIIGYGEMEETLQRKVFEGGLSDCVTLLGKKTPTQVREHMENADIFLFTSDFREGWGAVLNEAMNSGCAVVASHAIGASPFLIKHKQNGLIYESGNFDDLYHKVSSLLDNPKEIKALGTAAYNTICDEWNAETAVERLIALSEQLLLGEKQPRLFLDGPCSVAPVISESEVRKSIKGENNA